MKFDLFKNYLTESEFDLLSNEEKKWISNIILHYSGLPSLKEIWREMDIVWEYYNCDATVMDERVSQFYKHPIWLLNGFFVENDKLSKANRDFFLKWIIDKSPKRIADFGGGFGTLARMIAEALPESNVEVIEPHPSAIALHRAKRFKNLSYKVEFVGEYDLIIATDVYEHVQDPVFLFIQTASFLRAQGYYLTANCFAPVIKCHLPQNFHFSQSWDHVVKAMGMNISNRMLYGTVFKRTSDLKITKSRILEQKSETLWKYTHNLPGRINRALAKVLFSTFWA